MSIERMVESTKVRRMEKKDEELEEKRVKENTTVKNIQT